MYNCINRWPHAYFIFIQIDCYLYLNSGNSSESIYDTCGPRRHMVDVLWLFCCALQKRIRKIISQKAYGILWKVMMWLLHHSLWQETMVRMKVYRYKCYIGKFSSAATILPDFALHDCHTIFGLSLPRTSPHVSQTKLNQINKLSYNPTQVNKTNIQLL